MRLSAHPQKLMAMFGGFSGQKEEARARAYSRFIPRRVFLKGYHIVIASRECGDIRFLLACGIDPGKIIACDIDPFAVQAARELGVEAHHMDIVSMVRQAIQRFGRSNIASINVDLCCALKKGTPVVREVLKLGLPKTCSIFFVYRRGRRDGFGSGPNADLGREAYLRLETCVKPFPHLVREIHHYQSSTAQSLGSAMAMAMF